jgi:hypothetical protein
MLASRTVTFVQFIPLLGEFSSEARKEYSLEIDATILCSIGELGAAIETFAPAAACPFYLAALLLKMKSEVPIADGGTFVFGTSDVLAGEADGELKSKTLALLAVANILRLFSGTMSLADILSRHGQAVRDYSNGLESCCKADAGLRDKLLERERDARALAKVEPLRQFEYTLALLNGLRDEGDWDGLRETAERLVHSPIPAVALMARRMLALCLGRSTERVDHERVIVILRQIGGEGAAEGGDIAMLATMLIAIEDYPAAKAAILGGLAAFPHNEEGFAAIGMKIVEATGDHEFRNLLNGRRVGRSVS